MLLGEGGGGDYHPKFLANPAQKSGRLPRPAPYPVQARRDAAEHQEPVDETQSGRRQARPEVG